VVVVVGVLIVVVDVVPELAVAGAAPASRPNATAARPRSGTKTRNNFEASE
jgi:hypothetical protein